MNLLGGIAAILQRAQKAHVVRWVFAYLATAWVLYEVISLLVQNLGLSTSILKVTTALLFVGVIATVVLAYYHGEKGRQQVTTVEALLLTAILVMCALLVWIAGGGLQTVRFSDAGLVSVTRRPLGLGQVTTAYLLIHPQSQWQSSGVTVMPGQTVSLYAEGRIHLAVERLLEAAQRDQVSSYDWLSPSGERFRRPDIGRPGREACLLSSQFSYGALMVAVAGTEHLTPAQSRVLPPNAIFDVPGTTTITPATPGYLHFAVNDVFIDDRNCDPQLYDARTNPGVFYADNLGFFSVQLQVR